MILIGSGLYALCALACYFASSLEVLLAARLLQGLAAAAPRTVAIAMVRDLYSGREMAKIMSFVMMIFTIVPAIAPLMGQGIIALGGWHSIFLAYILFAGLSMLWLGLRQPGCRGQLVQRQAEHFASQLPVILGSVGFRGVLEDRLSKTGSFRQPDVAADPRAKTLGSRPNGAGGPLLFEKLLDVRGDFGRQSRARFVHAQHDAGQTQSGVQTLGDDVDSPQQLAEAVQRQEMGLQRQEDLLDRRQGIERQDT